MKTRAWKILATTNLLALVMFGLMQSAEAQVNYAISGNTAYVTSSPSASGNIVIASTYQGYPVTSISSNALLFCSGLTSVTIPNSVISIGSSAFEFCSGLTNVTIPNSVTSIGSSAFEFCSGLTNVTIPNSVTNIGDHAFHDCSGLTNVTIGNSVISIGDYAFQLCFGLTSVTIPNSVTSIGAGPFAGCSALTNIAVDTANTSYTSTGDALFNKTLTELIQYPGGLAGSYKIPNSVTSIGDFAFDSCYDLKSVTIPSSVTNIGVGPFASCITLTNIAVDAANPSYTSTGGVLFNKTLTTLVQYPGGLARSYTIPSSVTSIGDYAFDGCSSLTNVTIGNSVTSIGDYAFQLCFGLASVTIGNSVTSIGVYAFDGCNGLTSVTIPNSVTSIGADAFSLCGGLMSVTIPNSVINIGSGAFNGCSHLTSVTIGNGVTNIGDFAFEFCSHLTSAYFLANAPTVNGGPGSVDTTVFEGETGTAYYLSGTTGWGTTFGGWPTAVVTNNPAPTDFTYVTNNGAITITGYTGSGGSVSIPSFINGYPVTSIGYAAFYESLGLTSVTIPNSVTSIGQYAFDGCFGLTSVTIPNSVTSIGQYAFSSCLSLTSVTIPSSVTSIGQYLFYGCLGLTNVTIPNSVTSIGLDAFYDCYGLTSMTIPNSVTSIASSAFYGCTNLTGVYFQGNAPTPTNDLSVFSGDNSAVVYYQPGTTGWGTMFDGLPAMLSNPTGGPQATNFTFTVLHTFMPRQTNSVGDYTNSDGAQPLSGLVVSGNTLYGTTPLGDTNGDGTVFAVNTDGTGYRIVHHFDGLDGKGPVGGLVLSGNTLYGTTAGGGTTVNGGTNLLGTVFAVNTDGSGYKILHNFALPQTNSAGAYITNSDGYFTNSDGYAPRRSLFLSGNTLYGTAAEGGPNGRGTVFSLTTGGTNFTVLHTFASVQTNSAGVSTNIGGALPESSLVLSSNTLYGTTSIGGPNGGGTVFAVNTNGTGFRVLSNLSGSTEGGLVLWSNKLYGTTVTGPNISLGSVFVVNTDGTGYQDVSDFSIGSGGPVAPDGASPAAGLFLSGNTLYGTTEAYGANSAVDGTVFAIKTDGSGFQVLHTFDLTQTNSMGVYTNSDGAESQAGLILSGNTLYGTTDLGGTNGTGTVFALQLSGLPSAPSVAINTAGNQIVISWPTNATGYALQSVGSLSGSWSSVTSGITVAGTNYVFTVPTGGNAGFFRLAQ